MGAVRAALRIVVDDDIGILALNKGRFTVSAITS
jgi:hypothetical protein